VPHNRRAPQSVGPTHRRLRFGRYISWRCFNTFFTLHSRPSTPPPVTLHSGALQPSLLHPSLPRFTPPPFALALYCAALHPSFRRSSPFTRTPFTHSVALHPAFRLSSRLTPPPFTTALHGAALYPSFCRSLPFNLPPFTPPPPPYTPPPLTPPPLAPPLARHDLCVFRIVRLNLGCATHVDIYIKSEITPLNTLL
jgi:hypothetical protein